jgi:hypothetical protein
MIFWMWLAGGVKAVYDLLQVKTLKKLKADTSKSKILQNNMLLINLEIPVLVF